MSYYYFYESISCHIIFVGETQPTMVPEVAKEDRRQVEEAMPLAVMILVPILSSGLILVILAIVCIRRQTTSGSVTASPLVKTSAITTTRYGFKWNVNSNKIWSKAFLTKISKEQFSDRNFYPEAIVY